MIELDKKTKRFLVIQIIIWVIVFILKLIDWDILGIIWSCPSSLDCCFPCKLTSVGVYINPYLPYISNTLFFLIWISILYSILFFARIVARKIEKKIGRGGGSPRKV